MIARAWPLLLLLVAACASAASPPLAPPLAASAAAWRAQEPEPGPSSRLEYPAPAIGALDTGMQLWVVRRPARVVSVAVVSRAGASALSAGKSGLAALTTRMLTESTEQRGSLELAEAAESLGTTLVHDAGRDYSLVGLTVLTSDLDRAVDLLAEVVRRPRFAPDELERVRAEWIDGLVAERQSPQRLASLAALRLLLGEPHGAPVGGGVSEVKRLSVADITQFHQRAWVPSAAALVVVGDVDPASVQSAAARAFGDWQSAGQPMPPAPVQPAKRTGKTRVVIVDRPDSVQSTLFAAQSFPRRDAAGFEARAILNSVIGGLFTSRLNQNLREKNAFTYGARSQAIATRDWGAFAITTSVETNVTGPALREILGELAAARDPSRGRPLADDEIGRAKADLVSSLGAHLESVDRVTTDMVSLFSFGLPKDYLSQYPVLIRGVSKDEIQSQARDLITPEDLVVVIVGDAAKIEPGLAKLPVSVERASAELVD